MLKIGIRSSALDGPFGSPELALIKDAGFDLVELNFNHDQRKLDFRDKRTAAALRTEAFYIGALGSRRNQERRRERLLEAGVPEESLERISGPCGLDVGADTQAETALSILAEILAVRAGREGGPLRTAKKRIHAEVD